MKTEQEIVLQKKTFIIFSMILIVLIMGMLNVHKAKTMDADNEINKIYTAYNSNEKFFTVSDSIEENSNEIIEETEKVLEVENEDVNTLNETTLQNKNDLNINNEKEEEPILENMQNNEQIPENINEEQQVVVSRGSFVRETNVPPTEYKEVIKVKATAYCLCKKCCGKSPESPSYGNTASGLKIIPGTGMKVIAVDTSVVPLGTEVFIEGLNGASNYGYAIAADTGSAIKNNKIDLYMETHEQALAWGVKTVNMYILGD